MTSNKSKQGSKPSGYPSKCFECSSIEKRYRDPSKHKYCVKHQCLVPIAPNIACGVRKKGSEACCRNHYVPPCTMKGCVRSCVKSSSYHCEIHSCSFRGCLNDARPGHGRAFCDDHACSDSECPLLRNFYEAVDGLLIAPFCYRHECRYPDCKSKKYPRNGEFSGKDYCVAHCCNVPGCPELREGGSLGPLCFAHHNESIRKATFEQYQREDQLRADKAAREAAAERCHKEETAAHARFAAQLRREYEARERETGEDFQRGPRPDNSTPRGSTNLFSSWNNHAEPKERSTFSDPRRQVPYPHDEPSARFRGRSSHAGRTGHPHLRREDAYREDSYLHSDYEDDRDSAYRSGNGYGGAGKRSSGAIFQDSEREEPVFGFDQKEPRVRREPPRDYYSRQGNWEGHRDDMRGF